MKARDQFIQLYGHDVEQENVLMDTDEMLMWRSWNKRGEEVIGGLQPCEFEFWRNRESNQLQTILSNDRSAACYKDGANYTT